MANYRICHITRMPYNAAFDGMYSERPGLKASSFEDQMKALFERSLIYSDSFCREMNALGNECIELINNSEHIQKAWAREHGMAPDEEDWNRQILCAQIEAYRPDVLYIQGVTTNPEGFLPENGFRERFPFVKLVVAYSGFSHPHDRLGGIDIVISGAPPIHDYFESHGVPTHLVYHGFDESVLAKLPRNGTSEPGPNGPSYDLTFAGTSGAGHGATHKERYWSLVRLLLETGIRTWVDDNRQAGSPSGADGAGLGQAVGKLSQSYPARSVVDILRQSLTEEFGSDNPNIPLSMLFPDRCTAPVYGIDMYDLLARSRLSFNRHTNVFGSVFGNMRVFEATGVGSCLITDAADNVGDLFEVDKEIVTYASVEECVEKVGYLLGHDEERRAIAEAGQRRTLGEHTIRHRCEHIHRLISRAL